GSGTTFHLSVDFDRDHAHSASYDLVDSEPGWRSLALSTRSPQHGVAPFDWRHVVSVRLTADSRDAVGKLAIGKLSLSPKVRGLPFRYSTSCIRTPRLQLFGVATGAVDASRCALALRIPPSSLGRRARVVASAGPISENPPGHVSYWKSTPTSYSFYADSKTGGVLVFARGFDPRWKLRFDGAVESPLPVFSVVNGYRVPAGLRSGTVVFSGTSFVSLGLGASGLIILGLVALAGRTRPEPRRWNTTRRTSTEVIGKAARHLNARRRFDFWAGAAIVAAGLLVPASLALSLAMLTVTVAVYRITWAMLLVSGSLVLIALPVVNHSHPALANRISVELVGAIALACVLLILDRRTRFSPPGD
ncbi:MAG: hypothetical protein OEV72_12370, partial [Thermoleophilia bacterium]|nr:hypothetical protein [Thermoleophilia bacterium]